MTTVHKVDQLTVREIAALLNINLKGNRVYIQGQIVTGGPIGPAYAIVKSVVFYPDRINIGFNFIGLAGDVVYKIPVMNLNDRKNISTVAINQDSVMASSFVLGTPPEISFCVFNL